MEDEHGSLFDAQASKAPLELIAIGDQSSGITMSHRFDGELDLDRPSTAPPRGIEAGVVRESVEPGLEPVGVAQPRQVPPGSDEGVLDSVLRQLAIAEDEAGHGFQSRDRRAGKHREGVMVAAACPLDEFPLVHDHLVSRPSGRFKANGVG